VGLDLFPRMLVILLVFGAWTYHDTVFQVSVAGQRPDQYLESFKWDEAKYPPRRALNETVSAITETTQKLEDDLKVDFTSRKHILTSLLQCCLHDGQSCTDICTRAPVQSTSPGIRIFKDCILQH
jgi:hypothetical protein